jgi:hypothetical protein
MFVFLSREGRRRCATCDCEQPTICGVRKIEFDVARVSDPRLAVPIVLDPDVGGAEPDLARENPPQRGTRRSEAAPARPHSDFERSRLLRISEQGPSLRAWIQIEAPKVNRLILAFEPPAPAAPLFTRRPQVW